MKSGQNLVADRGLNLVSIIWLPFKVCIILYLRYNSFSLSISHRHSPQRPGRHHGEQQCQGRPAEQPAPADVDGFDDLIVPPEHLAALLEDLGALALVKGRLRGGRRQCEAVDLTLECGSERPLGALACIPINCRTLTIKF